MSPEVEGRRIRVRGQVQGVGMRPCVYRLALREGLRGTVANDNEGVIIEVGGARSALDRFERALREEAPPLARVSAVESTAALPPAEDGFRIVVTDGSGRARTGVTVDAATCPACLAELFDPDDRRYRYPLINCTECGPRFSLITGVPYDRPRTTMAPFAMCEACAREYADPGDRRYHAQPTCCPDCGPQLRAARPDAMGTGGANAEDPRPGSETALETMIQTLSAGGVVAIQGLGGFHLAAVADEPAAVARLREVKRRDAKPFAVMVADLARAEARVALSEGGREALRSIERPIVLAPSRSGHGLADGVAPGTDRVGVMLPYTPIQHLLFADPRLADRPLVMTSANVSDAPMLHRCDELAGHFRDAPVDLVVWHDRAIARRVDDGIVLDRAHGPALPVRRARGEVPRGLVLPVAGPDGLAVGGDLKNTFCLVRGEEAILSAHHGDLAHRSAREAFETEIEHQLAFFAVEPRWIACDLHPDFASTRVAEAMARRFGVPLLRVQHHFAHAASLLAESGRAEPMVSVVVDGFGYGLDESTWGGEVLLAGISGFRRLACLRPVSALGGDRYAREPIRPALAWLELGLGEDAAAHPAALRLEPDPDRRRQLLTIAPRRGRPSHSAGRLFDAAAALLGISRENRFEAESAMALEAAARRGRPRADAPPVILRGEDPTVIDPTALMIWLAETDATEDAARSFHERLAEGFAEAVMRVAPSDGDGVVGLTGGVAVNQTFAEAFRRAVAVGGLEVLEHRRVPANDGGLALGQAAIASAAFAKP